MKSILALGIALVLTACSTSEHHVHQHHATSEHTLADSKSPQRYAADKDLTDRMERIHNTMRGLDKGSSLPKDIEVKKAGQEVEATVKDIFANCKLEPAADAAIHPVLAEILNGANLLKKGDAKGGHDKIHHALLKYEELFLSTNASH